MNIDSHWKFFSISEPGHLLLSTSNGRMENLSVFCKFRRFEKLFECSYALKVAKLGFYNQ